jgi:two-component system chemotaxis response regulator CheB
MTRDERASAVDVVVVLAASAGGVEALSAVARGLPRGLDAGVVAVLHLPNDSTSHLPEILERAGPLPARPAVDGARLRAGEIVVAPPDRHVILSAGRSWLNAGPRENGVRPAADPLFRSAARGYGERAIGVVLSGTLDDGAAGLATIAAAGGATVVQDPRDAMAAGMPQAALDTARVDHVAPASEIGSLLGSLVASASERARAMAGDREAGLPDLGPTDHGPTDIGCPACGGVLREVEDGGVVRFRCRIGHSYSPETLIAAQDGALEDALWVAVRGLEDQASTAERVAGTMRGRGLPRVAKRFDERRAEAMARAAVIRTALDGVVAPPPIEAPAGVERDADDDLVDEVAEQVG